MKLSNSEINGLVSNYFPDLKNKEVDIFLSICDYKIGKNKELILKSGKAHKNLILILKGVARAYSIDSKGLELNNYIRAEGHLMGDTKVFGDEVHTLNIESIGEIHYVKFDISELEALGYKNPKILNFYLKLLKEIILTLSHRLHTFITMTPEERYLDLISWNPILIESAYDKHLASFLGVTALTISRIKKKLKHIK